MDESRELAALRAENAELRARVTELEREKQGLMRLIQATIDHVDAVIYLRDAEGVFTFINRTYMAVTGFTREAVIGKIDADLFPREVYEGFRVADRQVLTTRRVVEHEETLPQDDGLHVFRSLKFPVLGADGALIAYGGISTDLTPQRRAEADLARTQLVLKAVIENAPLLITASDRDGRYVLVGSEAARQFGRPAEEIVGKVVSELLPPELAQMLRTHAEVVFRTGEVLVVEEEVERDGQTRTFLATKFPIRDATGAVTAVGIIATDVTELRGAESERLRLQQEVIRAQEFALQELSTPIVPIADGALAVPLIGSLDRERMAQIITRLLHRVAESRAEIVILDLTGVRQVETTTMDSMIQATQAIRLLGVEPVLTGIQPELAQTMVGLDIPLQRITTLQTLQRGIEYALAKLRTHKPAR
jgi:rsbT co-antagonist protein RsbR